MFEKYNVDTYRAYCARAKAIYGANICVAVCIFGSAPTKSIGNFNNLTELESNKLCVCLPTNSSVKTYFQWIHK